MNAYIDMTTVRNSMRQVVGYYAEVVTEQDYHERGPFAYSHRTQTLPKKAAATKAATDWCAANGCTVVADASNL